MLRPSQALRQAATTGIPLPRVAALADLYDRGVEFRRSQLSMAIGRPKAGKSFFGQWLASEWARAGAPGLYYALDMTRFTTAVRQAAWATGHQSQRISEEMDGPGRAFYEEALAEVEGIEYVFDKRPGLPEIQSSLDAYVELWDRWPSWMVVDNLRNVEGCDEGHEAMKFVLSELQALAAETTAHIMVLHHASESGVRDYGKPPRANETDSKVTQYPEMVLSVAKTPGADRFSITPALQRDGGDSDPMADSPVVLAADLSRMSFSRPSKTGWVEQAREDYEWTSSDDGTSGW